ncbi:Putative NADPH-quinone reductase (modulator of drug activity B) [Kaistia soli DSM 19436]|uniref:Putative NADPH-quinone reductase (Modulator of drug activity B) n=1 Tax=Kaistia soli DSM 19436 TaxID=1122133 RepID=A0A1M4V0D0_9HYPH|nr:Putative NADPH-quinone reductase (modulator of drug activity B) [Kaistia soli DSM 19436]
MLQRPWSRPLSKRIVIIDGHPDPAGGRFCNALADAYAEGARAAGHSVEVIRLARLDIPFMRTKDEFEHGAVPPSLAPAAAAIGASEHIVMVFPLWLGTMPALVKAFLEQVFRPGTAFAYQENGFPKKLLAGRSARLVVTMGMPALVYRWFFGAHGVKGMERNILDFVGIRPVHESLCGNVEGASAEQRAAWLEEMRAHGSRGN